ncbi:hypothetical protein C8J56DRAFT_1061455 [Mycena floridula]|nr:hypothetical protein C8J56DRAFT_1061455 [Mycena floridula]
MDVAPSSSSCDVESLENSKADKRSEYSGSFLVNHEHQAETKPPFSLPASSNNSQQYSKGQIRKTAERSLS